MVPTGVSLKTLSSKTICSSLYLLIFMSFVKSRLRWLWHISFLFFRDLHETFLTCPKPNENFYTIASLSVSHYSTQIFIVSIPSAVILECFSFTLSNFHKSNILCKVECYSDTKGQPRY